MPWQPVDFRVLQQSAPFGAPLGAQAIATVQFPPVGGSQLWRVEQLSVQVALASGVLSGIAPPVTCTVYDQAPTILETAVVPGQPPKARQLLVPVANIAPVDFTLAGAMDVDDGSPPITVLQGNQLTLVFIASPNGVSMGSSVALVRAQVMIMAGAAGAPTPVAGAGPTPAIPVSV